MASHICQPKVSFFTKGRRAEHRGSYVIVDQGYVQYRAPTVRVNGQKHLPVLFVHGGGLSGAQWESTPDLRPGWACLANDLGYEVYIVDTVDNGRSGRAPDGLRGIKEVEHRTAEECWRRFRFGPSEHFECRKVFPGSQFPIDHFDSLVGGQVARRRLNDLVEAEGLADAIEIIGECIVIAHSHGAALMMDVLGGNRRDVVTENVRRLVLVEPGGTSLAKHLTRDVPTLVVWGDYVDMHQAWPRIAKPFDESEAEVVRLPEVGVKGNTHFPMSDRNSDEVFKVIMKWLDESVHVRNVS